MTVPIVHAVVLSITSGMPKHNVLFYRAFMIDRDKAAPVRGKFCRRREILQFGENRFHPLFMRFFVIRQFCLNVPGNATVLLTSIASL